ncbi:MAG TPA: hypothetical protein VMW56_15180 [Candidatus Margulisiibacteriota bacterium]|nr:hypothetical protein [Candidatus Margulisiibacteriota bacterium]
MNINLNVSPAGLPNGQTATYEAMVVNGTVAQGACDVIDATVTFCCPGADGNPLPGPMGCTNVPVTTSPCNVNNGPPNCVATAGSSNLSFPADGTGNITVPGLNCLINVNPGVIKARAEARVNDGYILLQTATGVPQPELPKLLDVDIFTPTPTETPTPTPTNTPTPTPTPTNTPTPTPTNTPTPTPTNTPTPTPTNTPTRTPTNTPTPTPTNTPTPTPTNTPTPTPTNTPTPTPTNTPTPTPTNTPTPTPTNTPTPTPTNTPTPTPTRTSTPTPTNTPTPTPTPTNTPTPTPTNTPTQTPTLTPTPTPTRTPPPIPVIPSPTSPAGLLLVGGLGLSIAWMLRRVARVTAAR